MKPTRRALLALLGGGLASTLALPGRAALRYPPPQFTPETAPLESGGAGAAGYRVRAAGAMYQEREGDHFVFRAFAPEPEMSLEGEAAGKWSVTVRNLHPEAALESDVAGLHETSAGLTRTVSGGAGTARFGWRFPRGDRYRFAAIGDTGGGSELRWALARARALGADFVLHLGDLNYGKGDYPASVSAFNEAAVPTYVAIGNHDFYEGFNSIHHLFRRHIGPRNASFTLGGVLFVNIDTAAGFLPPGGGARGRFFAGLSRGPDVRDVVVFTHKPLRDPRPGESHTVSAIEYDYLRDELRRLGADTLLAGHIHIKEDFEEDGLRTLISGQGLAHADLIVDRPYAEILLGDVNPDREEVFYHWAPLDMPFEMHCNPRAWEVLVAIDKPGVLRELKEICAGQ